MRSRRPPPSSTTRPWGRPSAALTTSTTLSVAGIRTRGGCRSPSWKTKAASRTRGPPPGNRVPDVSAASSPRPQPATVNAKRTTSATRAVGVPGDGRCRAQGNKTRRGWQTCPQIGGDDVTTPPRRQVQPGSRDRPRLRRHQTDVRLRWHRRTTPLKEPCETAWTSGPKARGRATAGRTTRRTRRSIRAASPRSCCTPSAAATLRPSLDSVQPRDLRVPDEGRGTGGFVEEASPPAAPGPQAHRRPRRLIT